MPVCARIKGKKRTLCIGDLNTKITLLSKEIEPPTGSVDYDIDFEVKLVVWALVQTTRGSQIFDGSEIKDPFTHLVYIRYTDVTYKDYVEIDDIYYKIVDIEDLDERHEFILLRCIKKGDDTNEANYA